MMKTTGLVVAVTILLACVVQARYTDDDLDRLVFQRCHINSFEKS